MSASTKQNFLLLFRHPNEGPDPTPQEMEQMMGRWVAWMKAMKAKGQFVGADRLDDSGKVVRSPGGKSVTDGPFVESKEIVGGFIIVAADNLAQAVEISRGCPGLDGGTIVEVRPIEQLPPI